MLKIAGAVVMGLLLIFIGIQVYSFASQENQLNQNLADINTELTKAQSDETDLQSEVQYLNNPANLEKELRARFNYKKPGETMIIIVPEPSSTASTSGSD